MIQQAKLTCFPLGRGLEKLKKNLRIKEKDTQM